VRSWRIDFNLSDWQHANRLSCGGRRQLIDIVPIRTHAITCRQTFAFVNPIDFDIFKRPI
jgi:hypothetical protein